MLNKYVNTQTKKLSFISNAVFFIMNVMLLLFEFSFKF